MNRFELPNYKIDLLFYIPCIDVTKIIERYLLDEQFTTSKILLAVINGDFDTFREYYDASKIDISRKKPGNDDGSVRRNDMLIKPYFAETIIDIARYEIGFMINIFVDRNKNIGHNKILKYMIEECDKLYETRRNRLNKSIYYRFPQPLYNPTTLRELWGFYSKEKRLEMIRNTTILNNISDDTSDSESDEQHNKHYIKMDIFDLSVTYLTFKDEIDTDIELSKIIRDKISSLIFLNQSTECVSHHLFPYLNSEICISETKYASPVYLLWNTYTGIYLKKCHKHNQFILDEECSSCGSEDEWNMRDISKITDE